MTALVSAELLRLRTVRSPRYGALGVLALMAVLAAMPIIDPSAGAPASPDELASSWRMLALVPGVIMAGTFAVTLLATEFQRGSGSLTYLSHPHRARVTTAHALTYAGLGFAFAGVAALVVVAIGVPASGTDLHSSVSVAEIARIVGGAAAGGAVMGAAGALLGTAVRSPTIASGAFFALNAVEVLLVPAGIRPYMPYSLITSLMGGADDAQMSAAIQAGEIPALAATGLLLAYLAAGALFVRQWALPRDLT